MALTESRWVRDIRCFSIPGWKARNLRCMTAKQLIRLSTNFLLGLSMLKFSDKIMNHGGYFLGPSIGSYNKDFLDSI